MIDILNNLLNALRERVVQNLAMVRKNETEIRRILTEPLSAQRSHNLNNRYEVSKRILMENSENMAIQKKIVEFISKHRKNSNYEEELISLNNFEEEAKQIQHNMTESKPNEVDQDYKSETPAPGIVPNEMENEKWFQMNEHLSPDQSPTQNRAFEKLANSLFILTAKGAIAFNRFHPHFNDDNFFEDLLNYHIEREEYEICAMLLKSRKS
ncbi:MAG: hypothetical protein WBI34_12165 [Tenuifilaceae bacterium]|jgi:hypothetical protein|nr:hypothetical protein [Bacteroidales bacterium]NLH56455.1 hypothetical protein [Rikenellaceae bacterium]OQC62457.1 MAG: hypothetical protein BWX49_01688 [Bacteroidetes bacterium ADurb.Bin008]HNV82328.1 hypothetical protein [Tenuifilaceae bacterium]MZP83217.1 hypothetical protein [Bacteroidales bacterium]